MLVGEVMRSPSRAGRWLPLFVCTLMAAPPESPCSASMLLVTTLTSWIDSSVRASETTCGSWSAAVLRPSMRVLFWSSLVPLTVNSRDRDGLVGIEWELAGGAKTRQHPVQLLIVSSERDGEVRQVGGEQGLMDFGACRSGASAVQRSR